jgi:hypothetical protein
MKSIKIPARVGGIPCQIEVFDSESWQLLDRRGRVAAWLEAKVNSAPTDSRLNMLDEIQCAIHDHFSFGHDEHYDDCSVQL